MNAERRKAIKALYPEIEKLDELAGAVRVARLAFTEHADAVKESIEAIRDEEQEYIDNLPENMQGGDRAQNAEQAVSDLDDAAGMLDEGDLDFEEFSHEDIIGKLDEVAGGA